MEVMLNSTLAGGVIMGAACDFIYNPGYAMICGSVAGAVSAIGFLQLQAIMKSKFNLHDTCGVQFLHGIPGLLGGFVSAIGVGVAERNFLNIAHLDKVFPYREHRALNLQACYQLAGMAVTLGIAITSGLIVGFVASRLPSPVELFDDKCHFAHVDYTDDFSQYNERP